jgi:hypothetical protein
LKIQNKKATQEVDKEERSYYCEKLRQGRIGPRKEKKSKPRYLSLFKRVLAGRTPD